MHKLEPAFDFVTDESSIQIHQYPVEVCIGQKAYAGNGEVRFELRPRAHIALLGYLHDVPASEAVNFIIGQAETSSFSINGRKIEGFCVRSGGDAQSRTLNLKWCPSNEPILGVGEASTKMSQVIFHIFNFVDFFGVRYSSEQSGSGIHAIEHADLVSDGWNFELKSLRSTSQNVKKCKEEGGYYLTHVGCLKRDDGASFSGEDARNCLMALRFYLSFAKGGWCEPVCPVGFDASDNRVWESWSSPSEPWRTTLSWFDSHKGNQLTGPFFGFMEKWWNTEWREALHEVIYWYLAANNSSRGIDAGIILTQAAIERLSYEYVVKDRKLISVNGFKDLWASDKFRLLFSSLGIRLDVTGETPEIVKLAKQNNWQDAPHALTEIRNSLVHPEHKKRGQLQSVYYEAWNLGLWYLEMGLLAICNYSGTYGNRLKQRWLGEVENVPWS